MPNPLRFAALLAVAASLVHCGNDAASDAEIDSGIRGYRATLIPLAAVDTSMPIKTPHTVTLLNDNGQDLVPPIASNSSAQGTIGLVVPPAAVTIHVGGVGPSSAPDSTYDTLLPNVNWSAEDPWLRIPSVLTMAQAPTSGQFDAAPDKAPVSGTIYWSTDGKKRRGTVGCAKVYIDGATAPDEAQAQRYVDASGLPVPLATLAQTTKSGRFYVGNMGSGSHTLKVSLDAGATSIGEQKFYLGRVRASATSPTKAVLYQVAIDVIAAKDPTPASCL